MASTTALILYRGAGIGGLPGQRLLAVGGILTPTGGQVLPHIDYNFPASPWQRPATHSLPPETRKKVAQALYEATLEEKEPAPKPVKRRRASRSREPIYELPTAAAHVRRFGSVPRPDSARIVITPPPKIAGRGHLQGRSIEKSHVCALDPSGGARGQLRGRKLVARAGKLAPHGIENLTDEQLLQLFEEAA